MIRNSLFFVIAGGLLASCASTEIHHSPAIWKSIAVERFKGTPDYDMFRVNHPTGYLRADGDFNGDDKPDRAEFLENTRTGKIHLVAFVSTDTPLHDEYVLKELDFNHLTVMYVSIDKPGQHRTVCSKRYNFKACNVSHITLRFDAIAYGKFESWSEYHYFNFGKFYDLWESD